MFLVTRLRGVDSAGRGLQKESSKDSGICFSNRTATSSNSVVLKIDKNRRVPLPCFLSKPFALRAQGQTDLTVNVE